MERADVEAWVWGEEEVPFEKFLQEACAEVARGDSGKVALCEAVAVRLLGPLHMPAVREALGCLVPAELDPKLDGKKPRGGPRQVGAETCGVYVQAGQWRVDVCEEQALSENRLGRGMLEFCLMVLRRVCSRLRVPLALGSHKLGLLLNAAEDAGRLQVMLQSWKQWEVLEEELEKAECFAVIVCLDDGKLSLIHI